MSKEIQLQNGMFAIVDDEDFERVNQHIWSINTMSKSHAIVVSTINNKSIQLGRFIMQIDDDDDDDDCVVTLKNRYSLDFRKDNLLITDRRKLSRRKRGHKNSSSKYKGVTWNKRKNKWQAMIRAKGVSKFLGLFENEDDAARAYNIAVYIYLNGEAYLNVIGKDNNAHEFIQEERSHSQIRRKMTITGYRGVHLSYKKYVAKIQYKKEMFVLGYFKTPEQAAKAYDQKAYELHGDKAILNFPENIADYKTMIEGESSWNN